MLRMRDTNEIKSELKHKAVELVNEDNGLLQLKLLEKAGSFKAGDKLSAFRTQVEEFNEETGETRFYDPEFANDLDDRLNRPYEDKGVPCSHKNCDNESGFNYDMTGYVVSDKQGIYVEKQCARCSTITTDGDGDFHSYFSIENGDIVDTVVRNNDAIDSVLFMHFDNDDTPALEAELYKLVDNYANQFKPDITTDERDEVVRQTIKGIDDETMSIDAALCDVLSGFNE